MSRTIVPPTPITVTFKTESCYSCGVLFAMTEQMYRERLQNRKDFCCPNGHWQRYVGPTPDQRRVKELEETLAEKERTERWLRTDLDEKRTKLQQTTRQLSATRGVVTRHKRRIEAGRCVCCSKQFKDLERHMASQHPNWNPAKHADALEASA